MRRPTSEQYGCQSGQHPAGQLYQRSLTGKLAYYAPFRAISHGIVQGAGGRTVVSVSPGIWPRFNAGTQLTPDTNAQCAYVSTDVKSA